MVEVKQSKKEMDLRLAWFPKEEMLQDPDRVHSFDFHKGYLKKYDWHKQPLRNGAHFTPIYYLIQILKEESLDSDLLECFFRRIPYINVALEEIDFITRRYKWDKFENLFDYYICRFEDINTTICELFLLSLNYYQTYYYQEEFTKVKRFEDIIKLFGEDPKIPRTLKPIFINPSLDYTLYTYIRNCTVHNPSKINFIENNQKPIIFIENIEKKKRYGIFEEYLNNLFDEYNGKKEPNSYVDLTDPRFPHYFYKIKLTKLCKLNYDESIVGIKMGVYDYAKNLLRELFHLQMELDRTLQSNHSFDIS